jgi:hypothetical protein
MTDILLLKISKAKSKTRKDAPKLGLCKISAFSHSIIELISEGDSTILIKYNKFVQRRLRIIIN